MESVVTLIAAPGGELDAGIVAETTARLNALGAETGRPDWLAPNRACDLGFDGLSPDQADAAVRMALEGQAIDVVAQRTQGRRKRLLIADMDSTIVTSETLTDVAEAAGKADVIAAITDRVMRGELNFEESLRERVAMLAGLSATALEHAYQGIEVSPGAEILVRTMAAAGAVTALVSGGFTYFTSRIAERLGFHINMANEFVIEDGELTGRVVEPILGRTAKYDALVRLAAENGLSLADTAAIGDGANDLEMIQAAGLGCAYRGKPILREAARVKLDHADLTGLLFAQGLREDAFVTERA
ncbi:MAG: phosphoserine phosphatase SerB [Rhodospirillales bacterium CG15_BIG_FIL_POST_REV_8_21_14_020_66_15]|nr:MAG: phosphoserine phosphatase SerB [Rhodospirillales bacterium CG15_BIG_FIL_POST_REV_8_21_14_020_66_15]